MLRPLSAAAPPATAAANPAAREAYQVPPRSYPQQSNTTPVGWVSPEERAAMERQAREREAARQAEAARQVAERERVAAEQAAKAAQKAAPKTAAKDSAMKNQPARPATAKTAPAAAAPAAAAPAAATPAAGAKPDASMAAAAPVTMPGHWRAHIASHRSEQAAINDWQERLKANPQAYGDLEPAIIWVDLPNRGSFARLTFGDYASKAEVETACGKIRGPGRYCNAVAE